MKKGAGADGATRHLETLFVAELFDCEKNFAKAEPATALLKRAVEQAGLTPVKNVTGVKFDPGVTAIVILQQSKAVLETWPELGYATVFLHTCGDPHAGKQAFDDLCAWFAPKSVRTHVIPMGPVVETKERMTNGAD